MTRARAVIGANFGDEGKGLLVDYLCAQGAGVVVRFNGGAQAGHTVVAPDGRRHVFSHVGAGAMQGVPTFLSQFFVCNPLLLLRELDALNGLGITPTVFAHPTCLVTTFADMIINQRKEDQRGDKRHGSVGLGINETVNRSEIDRLRITVADLWNRTPLRDRLVEICGRYAQFRTGAAIAASEDMIEAFMKACEAFAQHVHPAGIFQCRTLDPVFEGAQGLLLDQDNKQFYPHVTRSKTGMHNVWKLCEQAGISAGAIETYYVSRTYLTRHGAGPLPGERAELSYPDETNGDHKYQGRLRFAPLDYQALRNRCHDDCGRNDYQLVLTHCDQEKPRGAADFYAYGPMRADVHRELRAPQLKA